MDLRLVFTPEPGNLGRMDLGLRAGDLVTGRDLETAVLVSLFTDRRAAADDRLPDAQGGRRGWWGDDFPPADNDRIGSRLWLLARANQTTPTLNEFLAYAGEALQWLIDDQAAESVKIEAYYPRLFVLASRITIFDGDNVAIQFQFAWDQIRNLLIPDDENLVFNTASSYILTEDGGSFLTEDGGHVLTEDAPTDHVLAEDGGALLDEDGGGILE